MLFLNTAPRFHKDILRLAEKNNILQIFKILTASWVKAS
jgi:hypothetical protein